MKAEKIRNLTDAELQHQERELADQLFKLKFQLNMGQTESLKKIRGLRKDIARVKTILGERGALDRNGETIMAETKTSTQATEKVQGRRKEVVGEVVAEPHAEDDCGAGDAQEGASVLRTRGGAQQEVLRARREERSACGRRGAARGDASAVEAEALEAERHCAQGGAGAGGCG